MNDKIVDVIKALGDSTRLRIIKLLASNTVDSICVSDLAKRIGITQQATSQHIKILKMVGILEPNKKGLYVYYNINLSNFRKIKDDLDHLFEMAFVKCIDCPDEENCEDCTRYLRVYYNINWKDND